MWFVAPAKEGQTTLFQDATAAHHDKVITDNAIRQLAERGGKEPVTSFYLDVDGRRYPRPSDYEPKVQFLFRSALERARRYGPKAKVAVEGDLARIRAVLDNGIDRSTTRGLVLFSGFNSEIFERLDLPVPVRDQVSIERAPDVAQLVEILSGARSTLVALFDQERCRLVDIELDEIIDEQLEPDEAEHQVDTDVELGSFEPRHEEHALQHFRRVASEITRRFDERPVRCIVLSGIPEQVAAVRSLLAKRASSTICGSLNLSPDARRSEIVRAGTEVVHTAERSRRSALVKELYERSAERFFATGGLSRTLSALNDYEAETLVVEEGFRATGGHCPRCQALSTHAGRCSRCGAELDLVDNIVAYAITEAFVHHVPIEFVPADELDRLGRIAVLERHVGVQHQGA